MRIIFPDLKHSAALGEAGIPTLCDRWETLSTGHFQDFVKSKAVVVADLLTQTTD